MNTKIVYVLVSNENDYYVEMLQLSLYSLRLYHPDIIVEIVMDERTYTRLEKLKSPLITDAKPIVVGVPDKYSTIQRSRYLKTQLREIIKGDFLYLDTDIVIGGSLNAIDTFPYEIAAVLDNHNGEISDAQIKSEPDNWVVEFHDKQFNGGVLFVKDSLNSHRLFNQWHENWEYGVSKGCNFDQPALRKAIIDLSIGVYELDGRWNCQVNRSSSIEYQKEALILHYQRAGYYVSKVCREIRKRGKVCGIAASLAESPHLFFCGKLY